MTAASKKMTERPAWPETLTEWEMRMDLPEPERQNYYAIIKDHFYPPGDVRRYGAAVKSTRGRPKS